MYKLTKEFYAPTERGFSSKPYAVNEGVVTVTYFKRNTDPERIRLHNSQVYHERKRSNGSHCCEIVRIPQDRAYREVMRFEPVDPLEYVETLEHC